MTGDPQLPPRRRRWPWMVGLFGLTAAAAIGALHVSITRTQVLSWVASRLKAEGVSLIVGRLDYNLFTLSVHLERVTLSAEGSGTPFLVADAVRLDLPWEALRGALHVQSIEVDRPNVTIVRSADGSLNLPRVFTTARDGPGLTGPLRVDRLLVANLDARYADVPSDWSLDSRGLTLDLRANPGGPLAGRLSMSGNAALRIGDRSTTMTALGGRLSFDGFALAAEGLTLEAPEGRVHVDGTMDVLGADPGVNLRYDGRLDLGRAAPWVDLDPAPTGQLSFSGTAVGPSSAPDIAMSLAGEGLAWPQLGPLTLAARASWSGSTATIESARVHLAGGEVAASGRLRLDDEPSSAGVRWQNIDPDRLPVLAAALPFRVATVSDGALTAEWTGARVVDARGTATMALRRRAGRAGAFVLSGQAELGLGDRRWALNARLHTLGGRGISPSGTVSATGRLAEKFADSTLAGRASLTVPDLGTALQQLTVAGLVTNLDAAGPVHGAATAMMELGGTLGRPRASGTLNASGLEAGSTGPATAFARFDATTRRITTHDLRIEVGPNVVTARGEIGISAKTLSGQVTAALPNLSALSGGLPQAWRPEGAAEASATISGRLNRPTIDLTMALRQLRIAGQTIRTVQSTARLEDGVATVPSLELTQDGGRLSITGRYELDTRRYTFRAAGDDLVVSPVMLEAIAAATGSESRRETIPLEAGFNLRLEGAGSLDAPAATGVMQFARLAWGDYQLGAARAEMSITDGRARLQATVPSVDGRVDATVGLDARRLTATATIAQADLARLARASGPAPGPSSAAGGATADVLPITGSMSVAARADGPLEDLARMAMAIEIRLAGAAVEGVPLDLVRPVRLRYQDGELVAEDVEAGIARATLSARGRLGRSATTSDALEFALSGPLADLMPLAHLMPHTDGIQAAGALDVRLRASGPLDAPNLSGYLTIVEGSLVLPELPPASDLTLATTFSDGMLNVTSVSGRWQGASLSASGYFPATLLGEGLPAAYLASLPSHGPARADVRLTGLTASALEPFLDRAQLDQISGHIDLVADLELATLDADAIRAEVTLERAEAVFARVPLAQVQPTRLRLARRRLEVVDWGWAGAGNRLDVTGHVDLSDSAARLNLAVAGSLDLRMIGAFAPGIATAGRAVLGVQARGTSADPLLEGQIAVESADVIVRDPRLAVTDLRGVAVLTKDRIDLRDVTANANGGTVAIAGHVEYPGLTMKSGTLTATGRGLAIELIEGLRTEVDTDVTLAMADGEPLLGGRITIRRGDYRRPLRLTEQLFANRISSVSAPQPTSTDLFSRLQLNLAVASDEDVVIDNNYGRLELSSNLRVTGIAPAPVLTGRLTVREGGEVFLGGQTYTVRRGSVDFTNATRIEPILDLALDTRVREYDIALEIGGTPDTLDVSLRSPGLSQQEVVSLLVTGEVATEATLAQSEVARGQLLMLLSGELLSFAGQAVGLDTLQVSRGLGSAASTFDLLTSTSAPETRLTVARTLRRDVELIYSQSLRETGDITWIAMYRLLRKVEIRATSDDDTNRSYEFRHEVLRGGARRALPPAVSRVEAQAPRITSVDILGTPGFSGADIRRQLRLVPGDRFDFYRWQQDRDRLTAFFHDRHYLETRIVARRSERGPDGLALHYTITRGPRTTLTIEGIAPPLGLVDQMKTAWSQAVFDGFLVEDVELLTRRVLAAEGYLQTTVEGVLSTSPDGTEKSLHVRVVPGPRFDQRSFAFHGNDRVPASALAGLVRARGLESESWLNPSALRSALEDYYRSLGYAAATVTIGPAVFTGSTATLPVHIDEGLSLQVGRVDLQGVSPQWVGRGRQAIEIESGDAFVPAAIEAARRRIEIEFLRNGYNDVRVSAAVNVDSTRAVVDVTLTVVEGPQDVLAAVEVSSAGVTTRRTIDRALRFEAGQPVDLSDLYRAQKRLYDTGVFQAVDISVEPTGSEPTATVQPVRATVRLEELPRYRLRYGFRLTDAVGPADAVRQTRPAFVVDLLNRNLLGRAVTAGVAGQIESDRRLARAILSLPTTFGRAAVTNLFLSQSRQTFGAEEDFPVVEDIWSVTVEQRFRPSRTTAVSYGYTFSRNHVFEPTPQEGSILEPVDIRVRVARLTGTFAWDTRDDPSNASRGWFHSSGVEYGPTTLGSELSFVRYLAQQHYFHRLGRQTVIASAFRLGAGRGFQQDLLPSEKFFAGGGTSLRGFAEQGLGGTNFFGDPVGGNGLILLNQEVRFPVYRWLRGVGFIDLGNVFPAASELSFTKLQAGTGLGVRINSPFAIIRVDYGLPLTGRDEPSKGRWYFAIGQTF